MEWLGFGKPKQDVPQAANKVIALDDGLMETDIIIPEAKRRVALIDFDLLKVLGRGSFGKVLMIRKRDSYEIFAMKVLKKEAIIARNQVQHTKTERNILQIIDHPYIVKLHYAFQNEGKLYLILDYLSGGELFFHLKNEGRFSENRTKFYVAQLALALQHLHSLDIIYRDLKPENILLDRRGYICITDFGLSKAMVKNPDDAKTFCGTPEYLAPEILRGQGHGKAVDWWSLGTLMFEMLDGLPPFYSKNTRQMYDDILHKPLSFDRKPHISLAARDLLTHLMDRNPQTRFDWPQVQCHPFFAGLDWQRLYNKEYIPEFIPQTTDSVDTRHFDRQFTSEEARDSPAQAGSHLNAEDFAGFTYDRDTDHQFLEDKVHRNPDENGMRDE